MRGTRCRITHSVCQIGGNIPCWTPIMRATRRQEPPRNSTAASYPQSTRRRSTRMRTKSSERNVTTDIKFFTATIFINSDNVAIAESTSLPIWLETSPSTQLICATSALAMHYRRTGHKQPSPFVRAFSTCSCSEWMSRLPITRAGSNTTQRVASETAFLPAMHRGYLRRH